jgi:TonB family protein
VEDAKKQAAAVKIDQAQIARMMKDADMQRAHAMEMMRSGEMQRQIDEANSMIARVEVPPMPATEPMQADKPNAQDKPQKVEARVLAGNKIGGSVPAYPQEAKSAHISGQVLLHAIIDETGKVKALQVVSSPDASLSKSAVEAVQGWTYKPYLLNGQPTSVDTTITVNFSIGN